MDWSRSEFRSFIGSIKNSSQAKNTFLLFQTGRGGGIPQAWKEELVDLFPNNMTTLSLEKDVLQPYYPFLDILRSEGLEDDEVFQGLFHRASHLLKKYIEKETLVWGEEPIKEECLFEKSQILKGIWTAFDHLKPKAERRLLLIEQAQKLPYSTLELVLEQEKFNTQGNWFIILSFHPDFREADEEIWNNILFTAEKKGELFNLENEQYNPRPLEIDLGDTETSLTQAEEAFLLMAQEDSRVLSSRIHRDMSMGIRALSPPQQYRLWKLIGITHFHKGDFDLAMPAFQQLHSLAQKYNYPMWQVESFWRMGQVYLEKQNLEHSEKLAHQGIKLSREIQDKVGLFQSLHLLFRIQDQLRHQTIEEFEAFFYEILSLAEELGYQNSFASLATNPFGLYSYYPEKNWAFHNQGVEIAQKINNRLRQAVAHQTLGLVYSVKGDYKKVIDCYKQSLEIKKSLGDDLGLAQIHNGLGYYHYMLGFYHEAQEYYVKALQRLKDGKDFHEVVMTLFNMGANALLAQQPQLALDYLGRCTGLLRTLGRKNMAYHSEYGLTVITGLSHSLLGNWSWAWKSYLKIRGQDLEPYAEKNEELFWYHCFIALLERENKSQSLVDENLQKAEFFLFRTNDNIQYMAPFFYWLRSTIETNPTLKLKFLERAKSEAKSRENKFYMAFLVPGGNYHLLTQESFDLEWIQNSAKLQKHLATLHQKMEEIHFLNIFQETLNEDVSKKVLIQKTVDAIYANFTFQFVVFQGMNGYQVTENYYARGRKPQEVGDLKNLLSSLMTLPEKIAFLKIPLEDGVNLGCGLVSLFLGDGQGFKGHIMAFPDDKGLLSRMDSLQILKILASQLGLAMDKRDQGELILKQNEELKRKNLLLEKTSTTDHLTNIGNRSALFKALNQEINRLKRYRPTERSPFSLMFIDMDNFKAANDLYGHTVGDMILAYCSDILRQTIRDTDLLFRYGGDEFVVLLPETPAQGAKEVGSRIITALEQRNNFTEEIQATFGKKEKLPKNKSLGFSVGISELGDDEQALEDPERLLDQADQALYQSKKQGKGQVFIFQK